MSLTEKQLAQCQINDAKSQWELYEYYKKRIMGLCRRYTKNREEAEDVFQEIFIRAFQNISKLNDYTRIDQWMLRIAVNTAVNYYHKNKRHQHDEERNGYHHQNEDYELILSQFTDEMLINLINELPDGYRMVFNLHEVEGYSHAEIGEMLNTSEVTSRSQLNRAKQVLKNKLRALGVLKYEKYG
ncbi:MAG TPA: RNA polymerase sigma factor [Chryseolinea sp.]